MTPQAIQQAASGLAERILTDRQGMLNESISLPNKCTRTKGQLIDLIYTGLAQYCPPDEPESELHKIAAAPWPSFLSINDEELNLLCSMSYVLDTHKSLDVPARNRVLTYLYSRYFTP